MNFILLSFALSLGVHVSHLSAQTLRSLDQDKAICNSQASERFNWIINMGDWRKSYNQCLRTQLLSLQTRYTAAVNEMVALERVCKNQTILNEAIVDISYLGFQIAQGYTPRDLEKQVTSRHLEETLELYYDRIVEVKQRTKRLRQ